MWMLKKTLRELPILHFANFIHRNVAFKCFLKQVVTLKKLDECPAKMFQKNIPWMLYK